MQLKKYLVQHGRDNILKDNRLVRRGREDFIEMVSLVAHGIGTHGQFHGLPFDTLCRDNDAAIFLDLALIAPSTAHNYMDIRVLTRREIILSIFPLGTGNRLGARGSLYAHQVGVRRLQGLSR